MRHHSSRWIERDQKAQEKTWKHSDCQKRIHRIANMEKQKTIYQLWPAKINGIETEVVAVNVLVRNTEDRFTKSRDLPVRFL